MELPKLNVISLPQRSDRRQHIFSEFKEQGITDFEFWSGIIDSPPFVGIHHAHKAIVKDAKRNKYPFVAICEDDIKFSCIGAYEYFISQIPKEYDLFLGSVYWGLIKADNTVDDFSSLTIYIINSSYYDTFLSTHEIGHLDRGQAIRIPPENIPKPRGKFVVCNPFVCWQIEGYSDNVKRETDYFNTYMIGRRFYARSVAANNALIANSL